MAVDPTQLVKDQLDPVLGLDPTIEAAIPRQIEAQAALRGWAVGSMSQDAAVYVAILATKAMIPRLLVKFSLRVEEAKGGPAEAKYAKACDFLTALMKELEQQADAAAWNVDPSDYKPGSLLKPSYPKPDIKGFK